MLSTDEVKKINNLYQDLDKKEAEIVSLQNQLTVNNQTINLLNKTIENNKSLIEGLTQKVDNILSLLVNNFKETSKSLENINNTLNPPNISSAQAKKIAKK